MCKPIKLEEKTVAKETAEQTIQRLKIQNVKLKEEKVEMEFQVMAAIDTARIGIASDILCGFVAHTGTATREQMHKAIERAEELLEIRQDVVDERKVQYREAIEAIEAEQAATGCTVQ